jgi:tetratricopeptide (TPR) repeat protein
MFPFNWPAEELNARDFMLLELQFCRTISYFLPCEAVYFIAGEQFAGINAENEQGAADYSETWKAGVNLVRKERQPVVDENGTVLFLPIWQNGKIVAVSVLSGGSSVKYGRYSAEWLHERSRLISRELRKTKQWAFDSESGLLAGRLLRENIETLLRMELQGPVEVGSDIEGGKGKANSNGSWSVFLMEIFAKANNSGKSFGDIARAGACLNSFLGDSAPLSHFGSGLFGMLWHGGSDEEFRSLGYSLLRKLKRQNFSRVHIGITPVALSEDDVENSNFSGQADRVMTEAWGSLKSARRRGPFALCSSSGEMASQIFRGPTPHISASLQKLWRTSTKFSVVFVKKDAGTTGEEYGHFPKRICTLVGERGAVLPENGFEAYIFLADIDGPDALPWLESLRVKITQLEGSTYSMGIASFPCSGFSKKDVPVNARKALTHTAFYGPNTATVFDGVTLNISGDVYYNEGDIMSAVKEYKQGLILDPDNINLMNSLAVIYAQVNRYHLAIPLFEQVLELNPLDFMALFNLGFAYLRKKDLRQSQHYFEKALAVDDTYFDLLLQLGQMYCAAADYNKAVALLRKAEGTVSVSPSSVEGKSWRAKGDSGTGKDIGRGLVYTYLGQAYQGIGNNKEAMAYFQRAIGYNPKDAESLSRLGELYLEESQGNDIALSLCRQAVDIEETNPQFLLRLARIHVALENMAEGVKIVQQCLTLDKRNVDALLLLGGTYREMGLKHKAVQVYKKVLQQDGKNSQALRALKSLMASNSNK